MINRLLIALGLVLIPTLGLAWEQKPNLPIAACGAQIPWGLPLIDSSRDITIECHTAYIVGYDTKAKIPAWTSYTLTPAHAMGCLPRVNGFAADLSLPPEVRSTPQDYVGSGYDKGHNVNDGDMSWNPQVQNESFLMSNMSPQTPATNRGIFKELETTIRAWSYVNNVDYTIYTGNIYDLNDPSIGTHRVIVPVFLYKIVINDSTKEVQAYVISNIKQDQGTDLKPLLKNVLTIEAATGITFPLPNGVDKNTVASAPWPVDIHKLDVDKKTICKK